MSFMYPHVLWLLLLPALLGAAVLYTLRRANTGWQRLISASHPELVQKSPFWRRLLSAMAALLALVFLIIATARPINGFREGGATTSGRNLIIALDISRSMETTDVIPSRLEEARAAAYDLIDALPGDKIGLIVFSGEADLVVPLTYDHTALRDALEQINRGWASMGGTNFGMVLRKAMQDFKRSAPDGTNALVILSDGEDTEESTLAMAEEAKRSKLLVITVGIGTVAGGPIPDAREENGLWKDENGKHVISKLNPEILQNFAKATGGDCFIMNSRTDLAAFTRQAVSKIDRHEENFSINKIPNDLFGIFAGTALLLLVLSILCATEWRRGAALLLLLCAYLSVPAEAATPENAEAYRQGIQEKDTGKARDFLSQALLDEDAELQAAALYQLGKLSAHTAFARLRELYTPQAEDEEETTSAPATQVSPEALQHIVDELKKSLIPFQDALNISPATPGARENIERIRKLIKKLEEEIEKLKQQQQDQQNQQQQDQQNQQQQDQQNQQQQDQQNQQQQDQQNQQQQDQQNQQQQDQQNQQQQDQQN
ncbi:MAG: VWA domain-containing protein, partial [Akkermansia sp.]|nr:VWA domain-containing protein [Akkermansia sp.]